MKTGALQHFPGCACKDFSVHPTNLLRQTAGVWRIAVWPEFVGNLK
jgi:hypothetical protein